MLQITAIAILTLLMPVNASADFEGPGSFSYLLTVNSVYALEDDETVVFELRKIQKNQYVFKDQTGEIDVVIKDELLRNITVTPDTLIRVRGEIDKDWFSIIVEVDSVEVIN